MWNKCPGGRRRRAAISQSEIRKRCKLFGPIAEGTRAFREGIPRDYNPYHIIGSWKQTLTEVAWNQGWDLAQDKQREKDNESHAEVQEAPPV